MPTNKKPTVTAGPTESTKIYAPIGGKPSDIHGVYGEDRGDHIHAGIDVGCSVGTPCIAPVDGKIAGVWPDGSFGNDGGMIHFQFLEDLGPIKRGDVIGWGHAVEATVKAGDTVKAGQLLGKSNYAEAPHVHFVYQSPANSGTMDGTADPAPAYTYLRTNGKDSSGFAGSGGGGVATPGTATSADIEAISKAAAISTFINLPGILDSTESLALKGERSLMNDQPLLPFIEQLCQASLRNFMSMPNGNFFAFLPDYFGGLTGRTAYWHIDDIEILDGQIDLSDDALATHVYVVGDTGTLDGQVDVFEKTQTAGAVTVIHAFMADFLNGVNSPLVEGSGSEKGKSKKSQIPTDEYNKELEKIPSLANKDKAIAFLQKYGARPYYEEAPMIRSHFFEMFLAYQLFCLLWSKQFLTTFEFTFMPELFPGGIVAFPDHGIQCYVDEVTHEGSYTDGFVTRANLSAPTALKNGPKNVHEGMLRSGAFATPPLGSDRQAANSKDRNAQD